MKEKIIAVLLFFLVIGFVWTNTVILKREIGELREVTAGFEIGEKDAARLTAEAREIYEIFKKKELFISLTVNHEDLTNIEEGFAEMIGCLSVGDTDGAQITKSRLIDSLEHLGRLSGFNFDAII